MSCPEDYYLFNANAAELEAGFDRDEVTFRPKQPFRMKREECCNAVSE